MAGCRLLRHPDCRSYRPPARPVRESVMTLDILAYAAFFLSMALTYAIICWA